MTTSTVFEPGGLTFLVRRHFSGLILVTLMILHTGLLLVALQGNFVVLDEVGHVPAGVSHWQTGSFALYRVNPPLGRMLAALPVLLARPKVDYSSLNPNPGHRSDWNVGRDFAKANGLRYFDLICLARLPGIVWSLSGAALIFLWGRDLYGKAAGCLGAALWCFDPTVLAFAQVVTPDIPAAVAGLGASYVFWRSLRRPSWLMTSLAGILLGFAQLTKFTMLVLYGVWPLLWLAFRQPWRADSSTSQHWKSQVLSGLLILVISLDVINLGYGGANSFRPLGKFDFTSVMLRGEQTSTEMFKSINRFRDTWLGMLPVPVPAEYLQGIDAQRRDFESKFPSYLAGQWQTRGWWYYYLYALSVKEPIGTLMLVFWSLILTIARRPSSVGIHWTDELALLLPAAIVLGFVSSQTGFNHHMRYVLPAFPFMAIAVSKLGAFIQLNQRPTAAGLIVAVLFTWSVVSSLAIYPHSMSYFNEAVRGPKHGGDYLLDSNIDWGQDLLYLKRWLSTHPEVKSLGLAYYHFLDPHLQGIDFYLPPPGPNMVPEGDEIERWTAFGPRPGYFAISVNFLYGSKFLAPNGNGGWQRIDRHDYFSYFKRFRPIARAGYSIYIYKITPEEAAAERQRIGLPPLPEGQQDAIW